MINKYLTYILFLFYISSVHPSLASAADNYVDVRVELEYINGFSSPTKRYISAHSMYNVNAVLDSLHATKLNKEMFERMINHETSGFFGYHGGCSDYRIFQDIIKIAIEEYLEIPIRYDFQFLRVPGLEDLNFISADEFVKANPIYNDNLYSTMKHILSLNVALYQSWEDYRGFTPHFFLANKPWIDVYFDDRLKPFFEMLGLDPKYIPEIFKIGRQYVPSYKGFILQFFDSSHLDSNLEPYAFLNSQSFAGNHKQKHPNGLLPSKYFVHSAINNFPQFRLVMNNYYALNPYSSIIMIRYHTMHPTREIEYEQALRTYMRSLPFDLDHAEAYRHRLLSYWLWPNP